MTQPRGLIDVIHGAVEELSPVVAADARGGTFRDASMERAVTRASRVIVAKSEADYQPLALAFVDRLEPARWLTVGVLVD